MTGAEPAGTAPAVQQTLPRELEIKLTGTPEVIERALRSETIRSVQEGRARSRRLESTYFDTPDARLQQLGVGLRLRQRGKRWVQTLKRERRVLGGLHDRDEIEHVVEIRWPSYALYDQTPFEPLFADPELRPLIQPVFTTAFRRVTRLLHQGNARIELAFDRGEIIAESRHEPLCELELELKEGDPGVLFDLAARLCGQFDLRLDNRSKAERGYTLAKDRAAAPGKARQVQIAPGLSPAEAFVAIAGEGMRHLLANVSGLIEGKDPEYLHQARVALRRLRAAIALFEPVAGGARIARLDAALRALAQTLGVARDWDVFCLETLPCIPPELDVGEGRLILTAQAEAHRALADRFAQDVVGKSGFTLMLLELAATLHARAWEAEPRPEDAAPVPEDVTSFARQTLDQAWRRVVKRARRTDADRAESYHPLRIALKKLRYGGEYFAPLFARKPTRKFLDALAELQEHLGKVNDAATIVRLAGTLREQCHAADAREMLGALRGYFAGSMASALRPARVGWKRLRQVDRFWA